MTLRLHEEGPRMRPEAYYPFGSRPDEAGEILSWYDKPHARVLDLGCGKGKHAALFAERGHTVTGIDISGNDLEIAREETSGLPGLRFELADLETTDLSTFGIFDLVISLGNTLSQLSRTRLVEIFDMARRVLSPGGVLVFNTLYWGTPFQRSIIERDPEGEISVIWERSLDEDKGTVSMKGHYIRENVTHRVELSCFKAPEITNLLRLAGFTNIRWSNNPEFKGRDLRRADSLYFKAVNTIRGQFRKV